MEQNFFNRAITVQVSQTRGASQRDRDGQSGQNSMMVGGSINWKC